MKNKIKLRRSELHRDDFMPVVNDLTENEFDQEPFFEVSADTNQGIDKLDAIFRGLKAKLGDEVLFTLNEELDQLRDELVAEHLAHQNKGLKKAA